jgi:threonine dehydrogenase-like Zn-dependent dehydrogenase
MRVIQASGPKNFGLIQMPMPRASAGRALVRVDACSLCGSDLKLLRGEMGGVDFPIVPGHEWCGTILESQGQLDWAGRRIVADILENCGGCRYCASALPNLCNSLVEPGLTLNGAFAEFITVPIENIHFIPDSMESGEACLIEPLAVVLYGLKRVPVTEPDRVLILGGGGIGQLLLRAAKRHHPDWIALADPHPERRRAAERGGADVTFDSGDGSLEALAAALEGQRPPTLVFEVSGNSGGFLNALEVVEKGGRVGLVGYAGHQVVSFTPSTVMVKLLSVHGILSPTGTWSEAIGLVGRGDIETQSLLTHRFSLSDFPQAYETMATRRDGAIRVVVHPHLATEKS